MILSDAEDPPDLCEKGIISSFAIPDFHMMYLHVNLNVVKESLLLYHYTAGSRSRNVIFLEFCLRLYDILQTNKESCHS